MLVLTRKKGESIDIDGRIQVRVMAVQGNRVRLGIIAPGDVAIRRGELVCDIELGGVHEDDAPDHTCERRGLACV